MRTTSSEQEAHEAVAEIERCPRAREVNNRLQARIEACTTDEERRRWESLAEAIHVGEEISEREFGEWMALLPEPR